MNNCAVSSYSRPRAARERCSAFSTICMALAMAVSMLASAPMRASAAESPLGPCFKDSDVDRDACRTFVNGVGHEVDLGALRCVLGLPRGEGNRVLVAGEAKEGQNSFAYLFVFKRAVPIETIFLHAGNCELAVVPPDADVPEKPDDKAWKIIPRPSHQAGAATYTMPADFSTRAILVRQHADWGEARLNALRLFGTRLQNITPLALAYARHEFFRPPADFVPQFLFAASLVTNGSGAWQSSGPDNRKQYHTPAVSDVYPEWFMLAWNKPQEVTGLWIDGNMVNWQLESFAGPETVNPPRVWTANGRKCAAWRPAANKGCGSTFPSR